MIEQNEEFFKKWQFTRTSTMPNPYEDNGPKLEFYGFEARYVSDLEFENEKLQSLCRQYERTIATQAELHTKFMNIAVEQAKKTDSGADNGNT